VTIDKFDSHDVGDTHAHDNQPLGALGLNHRRPALVLVTVQEAARMLSLSRSTVYELIASGALPSVRVGDRMIRVPVAAIRRMAQPATDEDAR
jgi:excisionase family DNA binding protein